MVMESEPTAEACDSSSHSPTRADCAPEPCGVAGQVQDQDRAPRSRLRATLAVLGVWLALFFLNETQPWNPAARWVHSLFEWNYFGHTFYILVPLAIIIAARERPQDYGLTLASWRANLAWGGGVAGAFTLPYVAAHLAGWVRLDTEHAALQTLVFQLIMAGLGEEVLYRGWFQTRLNRGWGRPWSLVGVRFGVGLIITSCLFGLIHVLNPFSPLRGIFILDWGWGAATLHVGLMLGILRERTGSVLAPAIVHGLVGICTAFTAGASHWLVITVAYTLAWTTLCTALCLDWLWWERPEALPGEHSA